MPKEEKENTPIENYPLEWTAPGRPFKKRSKQFYLTALLIMLLVEIILFLFSQYLLMAVVISLVFVAFSLAAVPPKDFHYRISNEGVMIEDGFFICRELYDFYFKDRDGVKTLHLGTHAFLPGELIVTLGDMDEEAVKNALIPYLPYREYVKPTVVEKSADWLTNNFPLEKK
jgi:uncharacterized membrane protein YdbT with pleckstrin-like domain